MKKLIASRLSKKISVLVGLLVATLFIGHGCSEFSASKLGLGSSTSSSIGSGGIDEGPPPAANTLTVSLLYSKQILDNMVACSGIGLPSVASKEEWTKRQASFSEYGYATEVTAPMMMAIAALGGEICNDLITQEEVELAQNRRIFNSLDFTIGAGGISQGDLGDVIRRMSRSCWGRNETPGEANEIINSVFSAINDATDPGDVKESRNVALFTCTAMVASLSAITL